MSKTKIEKVINQIKNLESFSVYYTKKEIAYLPEVLEDNEEILGLISGITTPYPHLLSNTVLIVCTNQRLIFLNSGLFWGITDRSIFLNSIFSIEYEKLWGVGTVTIFDGVANQRIYWIDSKVVTQFCRVTRSAIKNFSFQVHIEEDPVSKLAVLSNLLDSGKITKNEFEAMKQKIIKL